MSMNLGINLIEVDGRAAPSIQGAPTSVAGFVIRSMRGISGAVRQITNFNQFVEHFGGYTANAYGAYVLRGFFDNGGTMAYVTRVIDAGTGAGAAVAAAADFAAGEGAEEPAALRVTAGYRGQSDPGAWGNALSIGILPNEEDSTLIDLTVRYEGNVVEVWPGLSAGGTGRQDLNRLNDEFVGSKYIRVTVSGTTNPAPLGTPSAPTFTNLEDGADDQLTGSALENALAAAITGRFDTAEIQLLCCPESTSSTVVNAALTYCANRGDCMFVGHTPEGHDRDAARTYGRQFRSAKAYGALYFPFIRVADPLGGQKWIPPTGHILGVYARTDRERGVWKAPAGNAARLNNALDVRFHITDTGHTDLVKSGSVNAVRFISGQGIVIDSSRTLSTDTRWLYVNVRLLFNFVKSSLKNGLRWVPQEPNDPSLWNKVKYNSVTPFLLGLWRRGAFGPGAPNEVFTVKVDAENNPPANIQQGIFTVEVYFYPSRPAETVIITVGQQEGGGAAGEG